MMTQQAQAFFEKSDHDGPAANFQKSNFLTRKDDAVPLLSHDVRPNMPTSLVSVRIDQPAKSKKAKKLWGSSDQIFPLLRFFIDKFINPTLSERILESLFVCSNVLDILQPINSKM